MAATHAGGRALGTDGKPAPKRYAARIALDQAAPAFNENLWLKRSDELTACEDTAEMKLAERSWPELLQANFQDASLALLLDERVLFPWHGSIEVEYARTAARELWHSSQCHLDVRLHRPSCIGNLEHGAVGASTLDALMHAEAELVDQFVPRGQKQSNKRIANAQHRQEDGQNP